ncbi:MAG: radical SAM protein [Desulfovibrio sp.]|jgi:histone acetyltransferase (RNA polymerase elongator complex component)|nr:radical SAM protein [Desulfovibrio sp.]
MNFLRNALIFPALPSPGSRRRIYPLFLPFAGCRKRCLFCAQEIQTGRTVMDVAEALRLAGADLKKKKEHGAPPPEVAFFGGTFTALAPEDFQASLAAALRWREQGLASSLRCSTRPDALTPALIADLASAGFTQVELGVQSFQDEALARSERGYDARTALEACRMVQDSGLGLGIQLMPGMPGLDAPGAARDVALAREIAPLCVRLYPCLVLEDTALARLWRAGKYTPWTLEATVNFLARSCLKLEKAGIAVIRMGLADGPDFAPKVLAGPRHPEIGNMARSVALYLHVRAHILAWRQRAGRGVENVRLHVPRPLQGRFWGNRAALAPRYAAIGLGAKNVTWWDNPDFALQSLENVALGEPDRGAEVLR